MIDGEDRYARLAAELLRTQSAPEEWAETDGRRDQLVAAIALAIAEKRRRRRGVIAVGVVLAAAAAVLLMVKANFHHKQTGVTVETSLVVEELSGSGNTLVRNALQKPLVDGARLVEGDSVEAQRDSSATLGFAGGTRLTVSSAGLLHIDELAATRRFSLRAGRFVAHVAKLGRGERFVVDTPDAEVEVRGTVFGIFVGAPDGCRAMPSRSTVEVTEGAVWVRSGTSQVLLHPGESWTSPCPDVPEVVAGVPAEASTTTVPTHRPVAHAATRHVAAARPQPAHEQLPTTAPRSPTEADDGPAPPRRESSLAEQNNLFAAAMAAEHKGDHASALAKLEQLIQRFPGGPLLESARAERQRILSAQPRR